MHHSTEQSVYLCPLRQIESVIGLIIKDRVIDGSISQATHNYKRSTDGSAMSAVIKWKEVGRHPVENTGS